MIALFTLRVPFFIFTFQHFLCLWSFYYTFGVNNLVCIALGYNYTILAYSTYSNSTKKLKKSFKKGSEYKGFGFRKKSTISISSKIPKPFDTVIYILFVCVQFVSNWIMRGMFVTWPDRPLSIPTIDHRDKIDCICMCVQIASNLIMRGMFVTWPDRPLSIPTKDHRDKIDYISVCAYVCVCNLSVTGSWGVCLWHDPTDL